MSPLNPLNPATGDVPVPEDQREIDAALGAGKVSLRIFPYLDWRYGERGRKFTQSDSAWLAWLTRFDQDHVNRQIDWLRSVLSNRGMPSSILDTHLRLLHRELKRRIPDQEPKYARLASAAGRLQRAREEKIPLERQQQLVGDFVERIGQGTVPLATGTAKLIVASVADEKLGVKNAVSSLQSWLADVPSLRRLPDFRGRLSTAHKRLLDSQAFEQSWRDAIQATIENVRLKPGRSSA